MKPIFNYKYLLLALWCLLLPAVAWPQSQPLTMDEAVQRALQQNKGLQAAATEVDYYRRLVPTSGEVPKTEVALQYGQYNSYVKNDNNISISQTIPFPTLMGARKQLNEAQVEKAEWFRASTRNELVYQVKQVYVQLLYIKQQQQLLQEQDSLFNAFTRSAALRYRTGESPMLEKVAAEGRLNEVRNQLKQNEANEKIYTAHLQSLLGDALPLSVTETGLPAGLPAVATDSAGIHNNPYLQYLQQQVTIAERQKKVFSNSLLPDITLGYFNQTLNGTPLNAGGVPLATGSNRFQGFQVGLALPVWWGPLQAKVKAEEKQRQAASLSYENNRTLMQGRYQQAIQQYVKQQNNLAYYNATALPNAALVLKQSQLAYEKGEIGYTALFVNLEQALGIRQGYLQALLDARQAALYIEFLAGNNQ